MLDAARDDGSADHGCLSTVTHEAERWREVDLALRENVRRRARLDLNELWLLREADTNGVHRKLGHPTLVQYMTRELGYRTHTAFEYVRVSGALRDLPLITEALGDAEVCFGVVRELTRVATPSTELAWLERAAGKTVREVEKLVAGRHMGDHPDDPTDPAIERTPLTFAVTPKTRAIVRQGRKALETALGGPMDDDQLIETVFRRALEPAVHGADTAGKRRPAYQTAITTCRDCKRSWQDGAGEEHELDRATVERARCDAEHLGDLEARTPARVTSTVTARKRRQVFARDHERCTVPGCSFTRNLDIHHIVFQEDGGGHELSNLTTLCNGHHQLMHEGKLTITGKAPDELAVIWVRDDGATSHVGRADLDDDGHAPGVASVTEVPRGTNERTSWKPRNGT
jgi:hypothetical protein